MVVSMKFTYLYINNTLEVVIINPCLQLVVVFYMVANLSENICNVFMYCGCIFSLYYTKFLGSIAY